MRLQSHLSQYKMLNESSYQPQPCLAIILHDQHVRCVAVRIHDGAVPGQVSGSLMQDILQELWSRTPADGVAQGAVIIAQGHLC